MLRTLWLCLLCCFCFNSQAQAQQDSVRYQLQTRDGNVYTGTLIEQDSAQIVLQSDQLGRIAISRDRVEEFRVISLRGVLAPFYNLQSARHFFSPNGYGLRKGEGYYQNVWVLFNQVSFGLTDHLTVGFGLVPTFFFGESTVPIWITPKVSFPVVTDQFHLGAGAFAGTLLGESESGFGIVYGTSTFGPRHQNVTLGLGYGYAGGDWADSPTVNLSGMIQTGSKSFLITENYFISTGDENVALLSLGARFIIRKIGLDVAGILPVISEGGLVLIPWLGLTVPFYTTKAARVRE